MLILVDTYNLRHTTKLRRDGGLLDYEKTMDFVLKSMGNPNVKETIAFVARLPHSDGFTHYLQQRLGFYTIVKKLRPGKADNFDVEVTLEALRSPEKNICIMSNSKNLLALILELQQQKRSVHVFGSGIHTEINTVCIAREIPASCLMEQTEQAEQVEQAEQAEG